MTKFFIYLLFPIMLLADTIRPVMIYDSAILEDESWNSMIHKGIVRFEKKFDIDVKETMILESKDFDEKVKQLAKEGYNPIMVNNVDEHKQRAIKEVMLAYPKKRYIILNGSFNIPNADFFVFSYQEATFLAGYLAAKKSQTNKIGFVGGMEIPVIKNFLCGYIKGARHAKKEIEVMYDFIGNDFTAWNDSAKGYDLTSRQIDQGADIIFGPAGGSSIGVLKAAHDKGKLGIGVDNNQNHLYPGSVLTSVMVRVDNAAYMALTAAHRGIWRDQIKTMGLQEKGVQLAYDQHNASLISDTLHAELENIKAAIILNKIALPSYLQTKECLIDGEKLF